MILAKNISAVAVVLLCGLLALAQAQNENDITPLMRAARDGEGGKLKALLKQGVDLEAKDSWGWTALIYAAVRGDERAVKTLLDKGANVNAQSNQGLTPLMVAAQSQQDKIAKLLIARGADINSRDKNGNTALSLAARRGHLRTYDLIEKAGAIDAQSGGPSELDPPQSKDITRPLPLNRPRPEYTEEARQKKLSGQVRARVLVGTDGQVKEMRVINGLPHGLTEQAARAAFQMRFKPAMNGGHPVEFWMPVEIEFNLK